MRNRSLKDDVKEEKHEKDETRKGSEIGLARVIRLMKN